MGHHNAVTVCRWDQSSQSYSCAIYLNMFEDWIASSNVNICQPLTIGAENNFTWPNY